MNDNLIPTHVSELRWANEEKTAFDCLITLPGNISFPATVDRTDKLEHIQYVWREASLGNYGAIRPYIAPKEPTSQEKREMMLPLTRRQLRLALLKYNITTAQVEATIDSMPEGNSKEIALIEWQDASTFYRTNSTLIMVAQALGLSPTDVDEMWVSAYNL